MMMMVMMWALLHWQKKKKKAKNKYWLQTHHESCRRSLSNNTHRRCRLHLRVHPSLIQDRQIATRGERQTVRRRCHDEPAMCANVDHVANVVDARQHDRMRSNDRCCCSSHRRPRPHYYHRHQQQRHRRRHHRHHRRRHYRHCHHRCFAMQWATCVKKVTQTAKRRARCRWRVGVHHECANLR